MAGRAPLRAAWVGAALALASGAARAQAPDGGTFVPRDPQLDALLDEAATAVRRGQPVDAARKYLEVEAALERLRAKTPTLRHVTEVGPGLDRGVRAVVRDEVAALPVDALREYRLSVDPRAREAVEAARGLAGAEALEALEAAVRRYPLSAAVDGALRELAGRAFEAGDPGRAARAWLEVERRAGDEGAGRQAAWLALVAAAFAGDAASADEAHGAFVRRGGDAARTRALGERATSAAALRDEARAGVGRAARPTGFDPGGVARSIALTDPEVPLAMLERLGAPPMHQEPVWDAARGLVVVADAQTVRAIRLGDDPTGWAFSLRAPDSAPSRAEAAVWRPALGGGRVFATLHRNRPAIVSPPVEGSPEPPVERLADWRVVALDAATGALAWDAASFPAFDEVARGAEWVSSPLRHEGGVYVTVVDRAADLRVSLVRLDEATGQLSWRVLLASRAAHDFLGLATPPPPPAATPAGLLVVATGVGAVVAVEAPTGEVAWVHRYAAVPAGTEPTAVLDGRRFRATSPACGHGAVVVAPTDAVEVLALDPRTGAGLWAHPRGGARTVAEAPDGRVVLVGRRAEVLERATGRLLVQGPPLDAPALGPAVVVGADVLAPTATGLARVGLDDGAPRPGLRWDAPREEAGAPLVVDAERLVVAGARRLTVVRTFAREQAELRARHGDGPRADVVLGLARVRRGEDEAALTHLERAARSQAVEQALRLDARRLAAALRIGRVERARARGDEALALEEAEAALALAWGPSLDPGGPPPTTRAELELVASSADVLRFAADAQAARALAALGAPEGPEGAGDAQAARAAARLYDLALRLPLRTTCALASGARVDARAWAAARLRALLARTGREPYAEQDARAAFALSAARDADALPALEAVLERWPAAACAADARWALAEGQARRGLRQEAIRHGRRFALDFPQDPRAALALARVAEAAAPLGRVADVVWALDGLEALPAEARVRVDGAEQPAGAWAAAARGRLLPGDAAAAARAVAAGDLGAPLEEAFRGTSELAQEAQAAVVTAVGAPWLGARDLVVLRRGGAFRAGGARAGDALLVRRVPTGEEVAAIEDVPARATDRTLPTFAGPGLLVVPHPDRVDAWHVDGPSAGQRAWSVPVALGAGRELIGPLAVHEVRGTRALVLVLTGRGEVLALDAGSGAARWRAQPPLRPTGGLTARDGLVVALSATPAAAVGLDPATGAVLWHQGRDAAPTSRLSAPTWLSPRRLAWLEDGRQVTLVDAATGERRWSWSSDDLWVMSAEAAADGGALVLRTRGPRGQGLLVLDAATGTERWRDEGAGPARPGQPAPAPPAAAVAIEEVVLGQEVVYSFRASGRLLEVWGQELALGRRTFAWSGPRGAGPQLLIETPSAVLLPRAGGFGLRVGVTVLARGTGEVQETREVPGRRLIGDGAVVRGGVLVLSTDRGTFGLGRVDRDAAAREAVALALELERAPDLRRRARLAGWLRASGQDRASQALLEETVLAEGVSAEAFDRAFAALAAQVEALGDREPLELVVRRMPRPPSVDGDLNDWWRPWTGVDLSGPRFVRPVQTTTGPPGRWTGDEDLSAQLYLGWDERYLYFALDVHDSALRPYDSEAERWLGDCLLIAIDCQGNGGETVLGDDVLLSLALTLPRKKKDDEEEEKREQEEQERNKPDGRYFVRKKDDNAGAIYEVAIPWSLLAKNGATLDPAKGPAPGLRFGLDLILTDDDGDRDPRGGGPRGALKSLSLTPGVLLHEEKSRLWHGYVPGRFARVTLAD